MGLLTPFGWEEIILGFQVGYGRTRAEGCDPVVDHAGTRSFILPER